MSKREKYDSTLETLINAGTSDNQLFPIIPYGKTLRLITFGGFDPLTNDGVSSLISIQWGNGTAGWQTIRTGGNGFFNIQWEKGKDFIGDGTNRFRIVRQNKSANNKILTAWLTALIIN